ERQGRGVRGGAGAGLTAPAGSFVAERGEGGREPTTTQGPKASRDLRASSVLSVFHFSCLLGRRPAIAAGPPRPGPRDRLGHPHGAGAGSRPRTTRLANFPAPSSSTYTSS